MSKKETWSLSLSGCQTLINQRGDGNIAKTASHIMRCYQWDNQALVKEIYNRLKDDGLPAWMEIEGGLSGNFNDARVQEDNWETSDWLGLITVGLLCGVQLKLFCHLSL